MVETNVSPWDCSSFFQRLSPLPLLLGWAARQLLVGLQVRVVSCDLHPGPDFGFGMEEVGVGVGLRRAPHRVAYFGLNVSMA